MKKIFFIILVLLLFIITWLSYNNQLLFSSVGISFTILGFILVIHQNIQIKTIAEESKKVAEDTKSQIFFFDISTKIPETRKTITQIKRELHELDDSKLKIILYILTELIDSLVEISHNKSINKFLQQDTVNKFIEEMNNTKDDIDDAILNKSLTEENLQKFASTFSVKLNNIDAFLNNINAEIKNNGGIYNG